MGRLGCRNLIVGLRLASMDSIGELDAVLDEEDGDIIANNVPVTLISVELYCESSHISDCVGAATASEDGGKS